MKNVFLWILASLALPAAGFAQTAPTYQGQDGQTKEAVGTFPVAGSGTSTPVAGGAPSGSPVSGNPVLVAGSDGTNARSIRTDTTGALVLSSFAISGNPIGIIGSIAHDAVDSSNPIKIGGYAASVAPTAVSGGDRVNAWYTGNGAAWVSITDALGNVVPVNLTSSDGASFVNAVNVRSSGVVFNGTGWDRMRGSSIGTYVVPAPTAAATNGIVPGSTATVVGSAIAKASAGNLYRVSVTTGVAGGYLMGFNATSAPADGAVTPVMCRAVAATSTLSINQAEMPSVWTTGIVFVFSTTGCFTKTISATAFFEWSVM